MAIAGLPVLFALLLLLASQVKGDWEGPVSCEEAFEFAMAELPEHATGAECRTYGLMDGGYRGTFQMPEPRSTRG
ncbi:hypothetical protein AB0B30_35630 [Streptomyces narbonensis]|uniref:Uncharacterized protein n=1 Tax=Streptomyces narbonensis TaxID=67333 RepID=A0ABV3CMA1_9ACTN